ncbi:YiiX/YebB-like N1pC/P60 family cysteine hydrolase [Sphingobacterium lumbrici]|uniref:YiiX/YebB-like N1pC/P60 family cysteine hydrolase n=1 Tax=Sphingobacterium lumbrici TaxID=2559600 RepID=UPI00112E108C|nr:YiiX/YebB-like N1pC/P60 family cysteine hydrolase [Sphingobacterium lumbrici]
MKKFLCGITVLLFISVCYGQQISHREMKNGDLIFVGAEEENLSGAINRVTQRSKDIAFDHVALLEIDNDSLFVLHASGKKGTARENFWDFVRNQKKDSQRLAVFRVTEEYATAIPLAIQQAKKLLGKPYNYTYVLNDSSLYCSDYIERIFRTNNVFTLQPMTFVNPETGVTDEYWKTFYEKQGMEIPEGKLGCNPNGLAQSPNVSFIGNINLTTSKTRSHKISCRKDVFPT